MLNRIVVVLVTYNRLECLKKALFSYENQSKIPDYIIVVNNASNDGTKEYLDEWHKSNNGINKIVIHNAENVGGSGGFYIGFKKALELEVDWVWVSDDDAYLEKDCINKLCDLYDKKADNSIVAICASIIERGEISVGHRHFITNEFTNPSNFYVKKERYKEECFEINAFSYVGTMIKKIALEKVGITDKDYFIYYDDVDHSFRISKIGKIICFPSVSVYHNGYISFDVDYYIRNYTWKDYYSIRNRIVFYRKYFSKIFYIKYTWWEIQNLLKIIFHLDRFKYIDRRYAKLVFSAVFDAIFNRMGVHKVYKPGWELC